MNFHYLMFSEISNVNSLSSILPFNATRDYEKKLKFYFFIFSDKKLYHFFSEKKIEKNFFFFIFFEFS